MNIDIFNYQNYKEYIQDWLKAPSLGGGHGARSKMAKAIGCQKSYIAQVLNGYAHFSLEQIESINEFMGHAEKEGQFLILLSLRDKAGSARLKRRFEKQIEEFLDDRLLLKNRLGIKQPLTTEHQVHYYSKWYYAAIHVMASQTRFQTPKSISEYLDLDIKTVNAALEFLLETGLLEKHEAKIKVGKTNIHLSSESPLIPQLHINWRLQAIRSLEKNSKDDLHYSSINTVSKKDAGKIREKLLRVIKESQDIIKDSPEDEIVCLSLDLFKI